MRKGTLGVAVPWNLSHYIPLNGFHPLYRALFDHVPADIELHAWDNVKLYHRFKSDIQTRGAVIQTANNRSRELLKLRRGSIEREYEEAFLPPNQILTSELLGDIEFHHTAPFPSLNRPFVFHCESFASIFFPFSQTGSGEFEKHEELRQHYHRILASPLCLGIFSHIPETLENLRRFFSDTDIDRKLFSSRIGLSEKSLTKSESPGKPPLSRPIFLFVNSSNQNPKNFFLRGGHIVLRFWKEYRASGRRGLLILRCARPSDEKLLDYGVPISFIDAEVGNSVLWAEDYLSNHEIVALMVRAHFFLLPSVSLHSASILQAMTSGTIPVVTDTVGTSVYVTDNKHGIVLRGMKEALWYTDPNTGVLFDRYRQLPHLDEFLVTQLINRVLEILDRRGEYDEMSNRTMAYARRQYSGKAFSTHFWDTVGKIYQSDLVSNVQTIDYKQHTSHPTLLPGQIGRSLRDCTLRKEDYPSVFEGASQPVRRINTGRSVVWELGGAFLHASGNRTMDLHDWSPLAQYYSPSAPKVTFAKILAELGEKYFSFDDRQGGALSRGEQEISPPGRFKSFGIRMLNVFQTYRAYPRKKLLVLYQSRGVFHRYYHHLLINYFQSNAEPDVESLIQSVLGFNIIRYFDRYYAIPEGEGEFILKKVESGGYSLSFSDRSIDGVLLKIGAQPELALENYRGFNVTRFSDKYYAITAVEGTFDPIKAVSGSYSLSYSGDSFEAVLQKMSDPPELMLEGYRSFNIIRFLKKYYAVTVNDGMFNPDRAESGGYSLTLTGKSVDEVREKIRALPELMSQGHKGFNIIRQLDKYYAIPEGEGEFNQDKAESGGYSSSYSASSFEEVLQKVDDSQELASVRL